MLDGLGLPDRLLSIRSMRDWIDRPRAAALRALPAKDFWVERRATATSCISPNPRSKAPRPGKFRLAQEPTASAVAVGALDAIAYVLGRDRLCRHDRAERRERVVDRRPDRRSSRDRAGLADAARAERRMR